MQNPDERNGEAAACLPDQKEAAETIPQPQSLAEGDGAEPQG